MVNLNRPGTLAFALRHAMDIVGAQTVADVIGCSISTLYKSTAGNPSRVPPKITFDQAISVAKKIRDHQFAKGKKRVPRTEHFSDCFRLAGWVYRRPHDDLNRSLTAATAHVGAFARAIGQVTDANSDGGEKITAAEFELLARTGRIAMAAIADVLYLAEAKHFETQEDLARYIASIEAQIDAEIEEAERSGKVA